MVWNFLWSNVFIPKIDIFCWTLAHKSILSGENLNKRGMEGPTRCPLCKTEEETSDHLILGYQFSKAVWKEALNLNPGIKLPESIQDLLSDWMNLSLFQMAKKELLQTSWKWTPKAICWRIWIEWNNHIFRDQESHPAKIATQARAILGEALDHNLNLKYSLQLRPYE